MFAPCKAESAEKKVRKEKLFVSLQSVSKFKTMPHERFNHNYNHCKSVNCELGKDCAQHLAYLEAMELGLKDYKVIDHCDDIELNYVRVKIE